MDTEPERALFLDLVRAVPRSRRTTVAEPAAAAPSPAPSATRTMPPAHPVAPLQAVVDQLDDLADLGFDVVYLPPIHPIGDVAPQGSRQRRGGGTGGPGQPVGHRGPGRWPRRHPPRPGRPGRLQGPWCRRASERQMAVALDLAFQCSPDHPWVTQHPEWFKHRPDGSIQYAENPPKRYQDIYPLDFEGDLGAPCPTRAGRHHPVLVARAGRHRLPGRQPPHQAVPVLGVADRRDPPTPSRHDLPGRGLLAYHGHAPPGPGRVHPELHLLHLAGLRLRELREYFTELASPPASTRGCAPTCGPPPPTSCPSTLQHCPAGGLSALRLVLAATLSPSYGVYGPELRARRRAGRLARQAGKSWPPPRSTGSARGT